MKAYLLAAICAMLAAPAGISPAHAASTGGLCSGATTSFHISDVHNTTTTSQWENLNDARLSFTSVNPGCAVVTFSGPASVVAAPQANYANYLHVRVLLDGKSLCAPAKQDDTFATNYSADPQYHPQSTYAVSISRICKNLPAGGHTVQIQYRQDLNEVSATILGHIIAVTHD